MVLFAKRLCCVFLFAIEAHLPCIRPPVKAVFLASPIALKPLRPRQLAQHRYLWLESPFPFLPPILWNRGYDLFALRCQPSCPFFKDKFRSKNAGKVKLLLSIATKMVSAPPVRGKLQRGQQVPSTILMTIMSYVHWKTGTRNDCNREFHFIAYILRGLQKSNIHTCQSCSPARVLVQYVSVIAWVFDFRKFITITDVSLQPMYIACAPIASICSQHGLSHQTYTKYVIPLGLEYFLSILSL